MTFKTNFKWWSQTHEYIAFQLAIDSVAAIVGDFGHGTVAETVARRPSQHVQTVTVTVTELAE